MNNLLDLALDFEKNASREHYREAFGEDFKTMAMTVCSELGIMELYEYLTPKSRQRFARYLTHRLAIVENPDVEWVPISETAIYPKLDNDTEVII